MKKKCIILIVCIEIKYIAIKVILSILLKNNFNKTLNKIKSFNSSLFFPFFFCSSFLSMLFSSLILLLLLSLSPSIKGSSFSSFISLILSSDLINIIFSFGIFIFNFIELYIFKKIMINIEYIPTNI